MTEGMFSLILNAHLPYVRHPEYDRFLEENWLFEALSETYLPLLRIFRALEADNIPFRLTISLSPTLTSMLEDDLLKQRYINHLDKLLELSEKEHVRLNDDPRALDIARMYRTLLAENKHDFIQRYDTNILKGFQYFMQKGAVELITSCATHAFLPLYKDYPHIISNQIHIALENHERLFQTPPKGFWLPECGYYPGLEKILNPKKIQYFISSAHGILHGTPKPAQGIYAPIRLPNGIAVFGRDRASSEAIWSARDGFPGHPDYREFYRDIGFDLPLDYIGPYTLDAGQRVNTGFKYCAITGNTDEKNLYNPAAGTQRAQKDAHTFVQNRIRQCKTLGTLLDSPPIIVSPFDAELFGHWWFEGMIFLESVFRELHTPNNPDQNLKPVTPTDYLRQNRHLQKQQPAFSSWGDKGYAQVWLDGPNDWICRHTHKQIERMEELVERFGPNATGLTLRALKQAARELLMSQASDWPFIIKTGRTAPYATNRVKRHIFNFNLIYEHLCSMSVSPKWLKELEERNNIFKDIDYTLFKPTRYQTSALYTHSRS